MTESTGANDLYQLTKDATDLARRTVALEWAVRSCSENHSVATVLSRASKFAAFLDSGWTP